MLQHGPAAPSPCSTEVQYKQVAVRSSIGGGHILTVQAHLDMTPHIGPLLLIWPC